MLSLKEAAGRSTPMEPLSLTRPATDATLSFSFTEALHTYDGVGSLPARINTFTDSNHEQNNLKQKLGTWHPLVAIVQESPEMD